MAAAPPTPALVTRDGGGGLHTPAAADRPGRSVDSAASSSRARARWSLLTPGARAYRLERLLRRYGAAECALRLQAAYRGCRCRLRLLSGRGGGQHAWLPFSLSSVLHPHQRAGVRWLYRRSAVGGILGDDPGLGKSLQAIALVQALLAAGQARRVLIVAPANLVKNWEAAFKRWLGKTKDKLTVVLTGAGEAGLHDELKLKQLAALSDDGDAHLVVVSSYECVALHGEALRASSGVDLLIADEAHRMRNDGKQAAAVAGVPARARLLLTATVLPNNLDELYSVVDLAVRGRLGSRADFAEDFKQPITAGRAGDADEEDVEIGEMQAALLSEISAEVMLRRTNGELERGLPPKTTAVVACRPTALQRALHAALQEDGVEKAFTRLQLLRAMHLFPPLLGASRDGAGRTGKMLLKRVVGKLPEQPAARMLLSGKLQACARLLDAILEDGSDKVVVVGSSVVALAAVADYARSALGSHDAAAALTGALGKKARKALIDRFNGRHGGSSSLRVLTLVDKLAEGVTLIGANHLILLDPSWNPAVDEQSLGRVHRPGQLKPCFLYRLVATGTIDETILARQAAKSSLLSMLSSGKLPAAQSDDRAMLFELDAPEVASRLRASVEEDSPYADTDVWTAIDPVAEGVVEALEEGPLRALCLEELVDADLSLGDDATGGADGGDDSDGEMIGPRVNVAAAGPGDGPTPHLVSFVFRSVAVQQF